MGRLVLRAVERMLRLKFAATVRPGSTASAACFVSWAIPLGVCFPQVRVVRSLRELLPREARILYVCLLVDMKLLKLRRVGRDHQAWVHCSARRKGVPVAGEGPLLGFLSRCVEWGPDRAWELLCEPLNDVGQILIEGEPLLVDRQPSSCNDTPTEVLLSLDLVMHIHVSLRHLCFFLGDEDRLRIDDRGR